MKITALIAELERLKSARGDLHVFVEYNISGGGFVFVEYNISGGGFVALETVEIENIEGHEVIALVPETV